MEIEKQIRKILDGYQPAIVLMTANELGIFDQLSGPPISATNIAKNLNLSSDAVERLVNILTGLGVTSKKNNQFYLPESHQKYLAKTGNLSLQPWIRLSTNLLPIWMRLPEYLKTGEQLCRFMNILGSEQEKTRAFIDGMHKKGLHSIWLIAREIPIGESKNMLDIGGGPGTYTLEWAKLHKNLKGTIFDIPQVIEITKDYINQYKLEDRVHTKTGNFNKDDLGNGYDLVLLANILHMYDADSCKILIARAIKGLASGGRIIIHGFSLNDDGTNPIEDSMFNLGVALFTEGGSSHTPQQIVGWLKDAGIKKIRDFRIEAIPTGVITGTKPE